MSRSAIANIGVILLFLVVGLVSYGAYAEKSQERTLYTPQIPSFIGEWRTAQDHLFDEDTYRILETRDVMSRTYRHPVYGQVNMVIIYSLWNRKVVHPPEVCLRGAGWEETYKDTIPVKSTILDESHRIILTKSPQQQAVLYWYKVGQEYTTSYIDHQLTTLWNTMLRRTAGVALVRLMSPLSPAESYDDATKRVEKLAIALAPVLNEVLP